MTKIQRAILVLGGIALVGMTLGTLDTSYGRDHPIAATIQFLAAIALFYRAARKG